MLLCSHSLGENGNNFQDALMGSRNSQILGRRVRLAVIVLRQWCKKWIILIDKTWAGE